MTLPATADVRGGIRNWGMLGNDGTGGSVCAATEHLEMVHNLATTSSWKKLLYRLGFKPPSTKFTLELYTEFLATLGEKPPETGINPEQWFPWLLTKGSITEWQAVALDAPSVQQGQVSPPSCRYEILVWEPPLFSQADSALAYPRAGAQKAISLALGKTSRALTSPALRAFSAKTWNSSRPGFPVRHSEFRSQTNQRGHHESADHAACDNSDPPRRCSAVGKDWAGGSEHLGRFLAFRAARRLPLPSIRANYRPGLHRAPRGIHRSRHLVSNLGQRRQPLFALDRRKC